MTNHAFASSQGRLTDAVLKTAIIEIVERRFPGIFKVEGDGYIEIIPVKEDPKLQDDWAYLSLHLRSQRKIEMRQGHLPACGWVQAVIQNGLAKKFKGKCSDEGIPDIWKPKIRFKKYKEYFELINSHWGKSGVAAIAKKQLWKAEKKRLNQSFHNANLVE